MINTRRLLIDYRNFTKSNKSKVCTSFFIGTDVNNQHRITGVCTHHNVQVWTCDERRRVRCWILSPPFWLGECL